MYVKKKNRAEPFFLSLPSTTESGKTEKMELIQLQCELHLKNIQRTWPYFSRFTFLYYLTHMVHLLVCIQLEETSISRHRPGRCHLKEEKMPIKLFHMEMKKQEK